VTTDQLAEVKIEQVGQCQPAGCRQPYGSTGAEPLDPAAFQKLAADLGARDASQM